MTYRHGVPGSTILNIVHRFVFAILRFIVLALFCTSGAVAQNESGVRFLSPERAMNAGYDSTRDWYHRQFPIIRSLPPLNSGMPPEVMAAYVHLDSLARFNNNGDLVQPSTRRAAWLAQPELLKKTVAALYEATDYNPVMFEQYWFETALKRGSAKKYTTPLGLFTDYLPDILARAASDPQEGKALKSASVPDYVLRVRVISIDSMPLNHPTRSSMGTHVFSAMAEILDTLKGQQIPFCEPHSVSASSAASMLEGERPHIRFQYYSGYYGSIWSSDDVTPQEDSAFQRPDEEVQGLKKFTMRPGQEAIVFLSLSAWKLDTMYDYFHLTMERKAFYALPIIDGKVRDVNRAWSGNLSMNYPDWRRRFVEIREKLTSGSYLSGTN